MSMNSDRLVIFSYFVNLLTSGEDYKVVIKHKLSNRRQKL